MSLRLFLLRHGETEFSKTGGYCGDLDPELTAEGLEMAQQFADAYRTMKWEAAYVSPMRRTIATARPICESVGLEMQLRDGLTEIRYGTWEGLTQEYVRAHYAADYEKWLAEPAWNAPTGGETATQIASRAIPVIAEILTAHSSGNVLIVSHKATLRILLCNLLGIDLGRYRDRIQFLTASVSVIKFDEHGPLMETLGDRSHLSAALRNLPGT